MYQNRKYFNYALILTILFCLYYSYEAQAQTYNDYKNSIQSKFDEYKSKKEHEFKEYRDRINAEFADYMRQTWPEYKSKPAQPVPESPEPPSPIIKDPNTKPSNDPIPFDNITPSPDPIEPPQPITPLPEPTVPPKPAFVFAFYGQECDIPLESRHRFTLSGIDETKVADGWRLLSSDTYLPVIAKCIDYRNKLHLCDWGYVRFVEKMTTEFFSSNKLNEALSSQSEYG